MQAIHEIVNNATKRFALPLNVNWEIADYYTSFIRDRVFGARHNAYSVAHTGAAETNPEYDAIELKKALKWAVKSTYTAEPTCNILVYPSWRGEAYQDLMSHPRVHLLHKVPQPHFSFDTPVKYTGTPYSSAHIAHWDVLLHTGRQRRGRGNLTCEGVQDPRGSAGSGGPKIPEIRGSGIRGSGSGDQGILEHWWTPSRGGVVGRRERGEGVAAFCGEEGAGWEAPFSPEGGGRARVSVHHIV